MLDRISCVLRVWNDWSIFPTSYLRALECSILATEADMDKLHHPRDDGDESSSQSVVMDLDKLRRQARLVGVCAVRTSAVQFNGEHLGGAAAEDGDADDEWAALAAAGFSPLTAPQLKAKIDYIEHAMAHGSQSCLSALADTLADEDEHEQEHELHDDEHDDEREHRDDGDERSDRCVEDTGDHDGDEDIDGVPLSYLDADDIDGIPLQRSDEEEDIDGVPLDYH